MEYEGKKSGDKLVTQSGLDGTIITFYNEKNTVIFHLNVRQMFTEKRMSTVGCNSSS